MAPLMVCLLHVGLLVVVATLRVVCPVEGLQERKAAKTEEADVVMATQLKRLANDMTILESLNHHDVGTNLVDTVNSGLETRSDECSGAVGVLTRPSGTVRSPGYNSGFYPNNSTCQWLIEAPIGQTISVTVSTDIENHVNCIYDSLTVYDGSTTSAPVLGKFCGRVTQTVQSTGNRVRIVFKSDESVNDGGFSFTWTFIAPPVPSNNECVNGKAQVLTAPSGTIKSPGYSQGIYPNNANCGWLIVTPVGTVVTVVLYNVDIEHADNCRYDSLTVYNGQSMDAPVLGKFCGRGGTNVTSTGNEVLIVFKTDADVQTGQFAIKWTSKASTGPPVPSSHPTDVTCGQSIIQPNINMDSRIVGGTAARAFSWPWQCNIRVMTEDGRGYYQCGGSVISRQFILTAAHCFFNEQKERMPDSRIRVICGIYDTEAYTERERQTSGGVATINSGYSPYAHDNDIAVIRLDTELRYTDYVRPICLPTETSPAGTRCVATGWGNTEDTGSNAVLRQVVLPLMSQGTCSTYVRAFQPRLMICAGYLKGGKDACQGDSGGPYFCPSGDRWWQDGIVSFGVGCARPYSPGVYTKVPHYLDWIYDITGVGPTPKMRSAVNLGDSTYDKVSAREKGAIVSQIRRLLNKMQSKMRTANETNYSDAG